MPAGKAHPHLEDTVLKLIVFVARLFYSPDI